MLDFSSTRLTETLLELSNELSSGVITYNLSQSPAQSG